MLLLNGGALNCKSSENKIVADSTCELEYIAASKATKEATWLKKFIDDLGVVLSIKEPMEIFCDNKGAVALTKEVKDHYIRHIVEDKDIVVNRVPSEENPTDPFKNPLSREKCDGHVRTIGMKLDIYIMQKLR